MMRTLLGARLRSTQIWFLPKHKHAYSVYSIQVEGWVEGRMDGGRTGRRGSVSACITTQPSVPLAVWQLEHMLLRQRHDLGSWGGGGLQHVDEGGGGKMLIVMFDYHNSPWKPGNPKSCWFILGIHPAKRPWRILKSWLGERFIHHKEEEQSDLLL